MNILYVAPRYHTNQVPIVQGWLKENHQVLFISQFKSISENYSLLEPVCLGYSKLFIPILRIYQNLAKHSLKGNANPTYFQVHYGFPPFFSLKKIMKENRPDIAILRDRSIYTAVVNFYCRKYGIKTILYNQTPLWEKNEKKDDLLHVCIRKACPQVRMTPVYGKKDENNILRKNSYYVPFVVEPRYSIHQKPHFLDGRINILCVGKFEPRKHHKELVAILAKLRERENISLTLVGECSLDIHKQYLKELEDVISQMGLQSQVTIKTNCLQEQVFEEYYKADLFVLPSTGEFASISQIEAMSCSLPIVCSDTNGTVNCIIEGENGYSFKDKDFVDLESKISLLIENKEALIGMGKKSYERVVNEYSFNSYKNEILRIMKEME